MSNLFQTVNGTAVTADGQPVGLVLDKSKGLELGPELIVNGTFDSDSDWVKESNWTIANGVATSTGYGRMFQSIPFLENNIGTTAEVTFDITELTQGSVVVNLYGSVSENFAFVGTHTFIARTTNNTNLYFNNAGEGSGFTGSIDNVSVKEVLGNHASQPVATQRPTYNANPDRLTLDLVDDSLLVNIPTGGWDGYMVVGTDEGTASYGVSLPEGDYELGGDYFFGNSINQVLFREGVVQPIHLKTIEDIFIGDGAKASYGDVTDFTNYWRDNNITEFPLIDTSSGTNFGYAWYGNKLTSFPLIDTSSGTNFNSAWAFNNLTSFPLIDTSSCSDFSYAWSKNNLTSFPLIDTSSGINFQAAWFGNNLTSFPLIDTSSGTNFAFAWRDNNLTSFPLINTSSGVSFFAAWQYNNLTSFPLIDTSSGTTFYAAWYGNNLTSFPLIGTSSGTIFDSAWRNNSTLSDFPANMFDNCPCTNFTNAFLNTALTQASIDGILVSINSNGTSNGTFDQSGGSAPSSVGERAIDELYTRGWTITVTGGYQGKMLPDLLFEENDNGFWYDMEIV